MARVVLTVDLKLFATVFGTVFLAELGDKTQLATMLYAADAPSSKTTVFLGAATALVLCSALGVVAGTIVSQYVGPRALSWVAGIGFVVVGVWTIVRS